MGKVFYILLNINLIVEGCPKKWLFVLLTLFLMLSLSFPQNYVDENPVKATDIEASFTKNPSNNNVEIKASVLAYSTYKNEDRTGSKNDERVGDHPATQGSARLDLEYLQNAKVSVYAFVGASKEKICDLITNKVEQVEAPDLSNNRIDFTGGKTVSKYYGTCTADLTAVSSKVGTPCFIVELYYPGGDVNDKYYKASSTTTSLCSGQVVNPLIGVLEKSVEDEIKNDPNPFCIPALILFGLLVASLHTRGLSFFGILDVLMPKPPKLPSPKYSYANFSGHSQLKNKIKESVKDMEYTTLPIAFMKIMGRRRRSYESPTEMLKKLAISKFGLTEREIENIMKEGGEAALIRTLSFRLESRGLSRKEKERIRAFLHLLSKYFTSQAVLIAYGERKKVVGPFKFVKMSLEAPSVEKGLYSVFKSRRAAKLGYKVDKFLGSVLTLPHHAMTDGIWSIQQGFKTYVKSYFIPLYATKKGRRLLKTERVNVERRIAEVEKKEDKTVKDRLKLIANKGEQLIVGKPLKVNTLVNVEAHTGYYYLREIEHTSSGLLELVLTDEILSTIRKEAKKERGLLNSLEGIEELKEKSDSFVKMFLEEHFKAQGYEGEELNNKVREAMDSLAPLKEFENLKRMVNSILHSKALSREEKTEYLEALKLIEEVRDKIKIKKQSLSNEEIREYAEDIAAILYTDFTGERYEAKVKEIERAINSLKRDDSLRNEIINRLESVVNDPSLFLRENSLNVAEISEGRGGEDPLVFSERAEKASRIFAILSKDAEFSSQFQRIIEASRSIDELLYGTTTESGRTEGAYQQREKFYIYEDERAEEKDLELIRETADKIRNIISGFEREGKILRKELTLMNENIINSVFDPMIYGYDDGKVLETISERYVNSYLRIKEALSEAKREGIELPIFKDREHLMKGTPKTTSQLFLDPTFIGFLNSIRDKAGKGMTHNLKERPLDLRDYYDLYVIELASRRFSIFEKEMIKNIDSNAFEFLDSQNMTGKERITKYSEFIERFIKDFSKRNSLYPVTSLSKLTPENLGIREFEGLLNIVRTPFYETDFGTFRKVKGTVVVKSLGNAPYRDDFNELIRTTALWEFMDNRFRGQIALRYLTPEVYQKIEERRTDHYRDYMSGMDVALLQAFSRDLLVDGYTHFDALPHIYNNVRIYALKEMGVDLYNKEEVELALEKYSFKETYEKLKEKNFNIYLEDLQDYSFYGSKELGFVPEFTYEVYDKNVLPSSVDREIEAKKIELIRESSKHFSVYDEDYVDKSIEELLKIKARSLFSRRQTHSAYPLNIQNYVVERGRIKKVVVDDLTSSIVTMKELYLSLGEDLTHELARRNTELILETINSSPKRKEMLNTIVREIVESAEQIPASELDTSKRISLFTEHNLREIARAMEYKSIESFSKELIGREIASFKELREALKNPVLSRMFSENLLKRSIEENKTEAVNIYLSRLTPTILFKLAPLLYVKGGMSSVKARREVEGILSFLEDNGFATAAAKYAFEVSKITGDETFLMNLKRYFIGSKEYIKRRMADFSKSIHLQTESYKLTNTFTRKLLDYSIFKNALAMSVKAGRVGLSFADGIGNIMNELQWEVYGTEFIGQKKIFHALEMEKAADSFIVENYKTSNEYRKFLDEIDSSRNPLERLFTHGAVIHADYDKEVADLVSSRMWRHIYGAIDPGKRDGKIQSSFHIKSSIPSMSFFLESGTLGVPELLSRPSPYSSGLFMTSMIAPIVGLAIGGGLGLGIGSAIGFILSGSAIRGMGKLFSPKITKPKKWREKSAVKSARFSPERMLTFVGMKPFYWIYKGMILGLTSFQREQMFQPPADVKPVSAGQKDYELPKRGFYSPERSKVGFEYGVPRGTASINDIFYKIITYGSPVLATATTWLVGGPIAGLGTGILLGASSLGYKVYKAIRKRSKKAEEPEELTVKIAKGLIPTEHLQMASHDEIYYRKHPTLYDYAIYSNRIGRMGGAAVNPGESYLDFYTGRYKTENWVLKFVNSDKQLRDLVGSSIHPNDIGRIYDMFSRYNTSPLTKAILSLKDIYGYSPSQSFIWWTFAPGLLGKWLLERQKEAASTFFYTSKIYSKYKAPGKARVKMKIASQSLKTLAYASTVPAWVSLAGTAPITPALEAMLFAKPIGEIGKSLAKGIGREASIIKEEFKETMRRETAGEKKAKDIAKGIAKAVPKTVIKAVTEPIKEIVKPDQSYFDKNPYPNLIEVQTCPRCGYPKPLRGICPRCHYASLNLASEQFRSALKKPFSAIRKRVRKKPKS